MVRRFTKKVKKHFQEIKRIKASPHAIALGFAIGAFISIMPTPGFSILLGVIVVLIFRKINKFSVFIAMAIFNPIVNVPIYMLGYKIGNVFFGDLPVIEYSIPILDQIFHYSRRFLVGISLLAVLISILSYFIVRLILAIFRYRKKISVSNHNTSK